MFFTTWEHFLFSAHVERSWETKRILIRIQEIVAKEFTNVNKLITKHPDPTKKSPQAFSENKMKFQR